MVCDIAVAHFLRESAIEAVIGILDVPGLIDEGGILILQDGERHPRHRLEQLIELLEERTREIEIPSKPKRIPSVGMPSGGLIRFVSGTRRIDRDVLGSGEAASPSVQAPFIPECKPPLLPAIETESGQRIGVLLSGEYRSELFEECRILLKDVESSRAEPASSRHFH